MTLEESKPDSLVKDEWMIRPCKAYNEEYKDCRSIKGRFHQNFIHGTSLDCSQWKRDYNNCVKWEKEGNLKAGEEVIKSETARRLERFKGHYGNTVWEKRDTPPEDWNKPLPEDMQKKYENTYLNLKAQQEREGIPTTVDTAGFCTIS